jgi:hypothetical protein
MHLIQPQLMGSWLSRVQMGGSPEDSLRFNDPKQNGGTRNDWEIAADGAKH